MITNEINKAIDQYEESLKKRKTFLELLVRYYQGFVYFILF